MPDGARVGEAVRERARRSFTLPWQRRPADEIPANAEGALAQLATFGTEPVGLHALRAIPRMGPDSILRGTNAAIASLAYRRPIRPEDVARAHEFYGHHPSFAWAMANPDEPPADDYGYAGFVLSRARRLQAVDAGAPFALLSPVMAWELGEDVVVSPLPRAPYAQPDWEYAPPHFDPRLWDEV
jgi:hypothetical protein